MKVIYVFIFTLIVSCTVKKAEPEAAVADTTDTEVDSAVMKGDIPDYEAMFKLETYVVPPQGDTSLVQEIHESMALIVLPTPAQVEAMEAEYGEDFYTIADDASYYQSIAMQMIDSLQVKTVHASKRFVQFTTEEDTVTLDVRKQGVPEWNIIFFHVKKKPEIIPAIELTEEHIKNYFDL
jgi:hypothetical protein